jgi:hypothetical protein
MIKLKDKIRELADSSNKLSDTDKLKKEINILFRYIFDINSDHEGLPIVEGPFQGGTDKEIQGKIDKLYIKNVWNGRTDNSFNEFFYIHNKSLSEIITVVRIYNGSTDLDPFTAAYELGFDYTNEEYRGLKLYSFLYEARHNYIIKKTNYKKKYVLYTRE